MSELINLRELAKPLPLDRLQIRVAELRKSARGDVYARLLVYKDSRVDMEVLDEVVGPDRWNLDVQIIPGDEEVTAVARLTVVLEGGREVTKTGVGSGRDAKSAASDALKRAGFLYGIGRELYSYPDIVVKLKDGEWYERNGRLGLSNSARLNDWRLERKNGKLVLLDAHGNVRWEEK